MGLFPLLGGKGGNSASPHAGARILPFPESAEVDDVPVVLPVLVEAVERDASDVTDSREFLRCSDGSADGLRGRAGVIGAFREGSGGGTLAGF